MHTIKGTTRSDQSGFSLIWLVAVIVIIAALGAAVLNMSRTSRTNEMMLTFDTQARMLAESGMNYALNYAADILNGAQSNALTTLNGTTITTGLGSGQQISLTVTVSPSNAYDYVVTSVGTVNQGTKFEANYSLTNVINAPNSGTGVYVVESKPGTTTASPTGINVYASTLTNYTAGISFDPRFAGSGNSVSGAGFSNGIGNLGNGFRAYFTFSISSGSNADGFVFSVKNGTWNGPYDAGGPLAGISHGAMLGYAGPGYPYWGHGLGLRPPKLGVEFDIYLNSGHTGISDGDGRNDPDNHHIANIFWGTTWNVGSNPAVAPTNTYATSSSYAFDDNVHNIGGSNNASDPRPLNPNGGTGLLSLTRTTMVGTASPVPVRIEVVRPSSVVSSTPSDPHYNMYAYVVKTWYNCTAAGCSNINADYGGTTTLSYTVYMTQTEHTEFQKFVYGYQVSTGASTGQYNFSIPTIGMR